MVPVIHGRSLQCQSFIRVLFPATGKSFFSHINLTRYKRDDGTEAYLEDHDRTMWMRDEDSFGIGGNVRLGGNAEPPWRVITHTIPVAGRRDAARYTAYTC